MNKPKLTKWFDGNKFVPGHVGWWHTGESNENPINGGNESNYCWWWDGEHWRVSQLGDICSAQNRTFRGLKDKPA